jgi:hypothetical protein
VRLGIPSLIALVVLALVGCGGKSEPVAPLPVAQRLLSAEDAPGTKPDPVETRQTTADFDTFIAALRDAVVDPHDKEMASVFRDAGFKRAGLDARFFGKTHSFNAPHVFSAFVELESEDGAASALDWLETDSKKPCPMSCAVRRSTFDVDDIDGARGVHRIATAADVQKMGFPDEQPEDSYWVGFTAGPFVYTMELHGRPGSVSEKQALDIARAYHDRLAA